MWRRWRRGPPRWSHGMGGIRIARRDSLPLVPPCDYGLSVSRDATAQPVRLPLSGSQSAVVLAHAALSQAVHRPMRLVAAARCVQPALAKRAGHARRGRATADAFCHASWGHRAGTILGRYLAGGNGTARLPGDWGRRA